MEGIMEDVYEGRGDSEERISLAGFLFGNIDESGHLEDSDLLDEESQRHLGQLASLGALGPLVDDLASENEDEDSPDRRDEPGSSFDNRSAAVDYSDINELAEEEERRQPHYELSDLHKKQSIAGDHNKEEGVIKAKPAVTPDMPWALPSVVPKAETVEQANELQEKQKLADLFSPPSPTYSKFEVSSSSSKATESPVEVQASLHETFSSASVSTPTLPSPTTILPSHRVTGAGKQPGGTGPVVPVAKTADGKTVTELFPEFRPGKVLRFSRLFGPKKYVSAQWKGLRKKKKKKKLNGGESDTGGTKKERGIQIIEPRPPRPEEIASDDEDKFLGDIPIELYAPAHMIKRILTSEERAPQKTKECAPCEWRYGPAAYWYNLYDVNPDGSDFDYGFQLKKEETDDGNLDEAALDKAIESTLPPNDCFNMVVQSTWEDDVIWDSSTYQQTRQSLIAQARAGWIPSGNIRSIQAYVSHLKDRVDKTSPEAIACEAILKNFNQGLINIKLNKDPNSHKLSNFYSLFPVDNEELVYGKWEDKVIWDDQAMSKIPSPEIFRLDPNDENLILIMPEDVDPNETVEQEQTPKKDSKSKSRFTNKNKQEEEKKEVAVRQTPLKDPFNLSNDEYYMPKQDLAENQLHAEFSGLTIQHSTPGMELQRPFFPTYLSPNDLRHIHRPQIVKKKFGILSKSGPHVIHDLHKVIKKKAKEREKERQAFGGGEMFFMRQPQDLTGFDGDLVLFEYCEEYPPVLSQVGMNTRIKNYYKRKHGKDAGAPELEYGEVSYTHHSPFLGQLTPGEVVQALENNLYRAPVYMHPNPFTDFLLIRNSQGYYIRRVKDIFTVGQQCPKYEVPGPNSKRANNHMRDFLQVFIYRLFWKSPDTPRRIKMEDIRKAFPKHSESSVRKRLKLCADFRRTGADCNWWVLKQDFRLPTEEEMRNMVTPEQTCAYYSMQAAEQRLKDAGYGEKSLFAPDEDETENDARKIDDEIQTAPWNTTRAFIQAIKGKCLLQVNGVADPTGCGEGLSYIRIPNKPVTGKDEAKQVSDQKKQKLVTGTDADLRRLNLKQARNLLREFGVTEEEIKALSRWEVIDKVRTMSTEAARSGGEGDMSKFARGSRFTVAEHQEKYKEECQRIFDLQNRVLSSDAVLSTDEETSDEETSDLDELGKDLESMLSNKKTSSQLSHDHEEVERKELQKLLSEDRAADKDRDDVNRSLDSSRPLSSLSGSRRPDDDDSQSVISLDNSAGRRLLIHRTFKERDQEYVRTEVVKNQAVIDAYLRIVTRDKNYRQVFASQDEKHKEDMRRERRRIQEQLRRIKRNQEKEKMREMQKPSAIPKIHSDKPLKNLKCGACGGVGHMKTNKMCPKYQEAGAYQVAMTDEELVSEEMSNLSQDDLIKVEGTKIVLGKALLEATQDIKRKALMIRIPKETVVPPPKKRKKTSSASLHADYLVRHHTNKNRRRTNPVVALSLLFENIVARMKEVPESWPFHSPVSSKTVPDYHNVVKNPMDLQTIKENVKKGHYHTREEFMDHVTQVYSNCVLYNGMSHPLTKVAEEMVNVATAFVESKDSEIMQLEKEINPLLDGDPQIGFSWLLETIVSQLKAMPNSWPFHNPVSAKNVPDYYDIVKTPMDIETIRQHCQENRYQDRDQFLADVGYIHTNSHTYNGPDHEFTKTAQKMYEHCVQVLKQHDEQLSQLENDIVQQLLHHQEQQQQKGDMGPTELDPSEKDAAEVAAAEFLGSLVRGRSSQNESPKTFSEVTKQVITPGDEDEEVDIEGDYLDDSSNAYIGDDYEFNSVDNSLTLQQDQVDNSGFLLLQDLQTSPVHSGVSESDDEGTDDEIPLDDGDEDDDFLIEEDSRMGEDFEDEGVKNEDSFEPEETDNTEQEAAFHDDDDDAEDEDDDNDFEDVNEDDNFGLF